MEELTPASLATFDAVLISADHDAVDYHSIESHSRLIVDTRNVFARKGISSQKIVKS